jgi:hypothetical protein
MMRILSILLVVVLTRTDALYAEEEVAPHDELQVMRSQLADRLSPTEAMLLQRIDEAERKIEMHNPWLQPAVAIACVAALIGWGLALLQYFGNKNLRVWELMLESLRWFEGGTQKRSIGIALVESKWDIHQEFHGRWASILMNQAIYLLTRKDDRDEVHERANLYRIMNLLIDKVDPSGHIAKLERDILRDTLNEYDQNSKRGLINIDNKCFEKWKTHFCKQLSTQDSEKK